AAPEEIAQSALRGGDGGLCAPARRGCGDRGAQSRLRGQRRSDRSVRGCSGPPSAVDRRVVVAQGGVCRAGLPESTGSGPGFRRPVIVVQSDAFNRSSIATVVCTPLTSNLRWAQAPGNTLLPARSTGLPRDSVA